MTIPVSLDDFAPASPSAGAQDDSPERSAAGPAAIPHVVAWNLTKRCNLACAHCYISAGPWHSSDGEMTFDEVKRIADEIFAINPAPMFVLTGGEPLLRDDLEDIAAYSKSKGATVVVGTNGTQLTAERIASLKDSGVTGIAVSVDSLEARYHDRFRHGEGALADTVASIERLRAVGMDFIVQTSLTPGNRHELRDLVAWSAEMGAVCFNLYFLVETGRGEGMKSLEPQHNDEVLIELAELQREYRGRIMIRSKCQPQIMRHIHERDPDSPLANYATRCPCGVQYCRITPDGKVTPCPYLPEVAGDLRRQSFSEVWNDSAVFQRIRSGELGGKCGRCEYKNVCGGCRARAFTQDGDFMAADESCAYEPTGEIEPIVADGAATYGAAEESTLEWSDEARARIERIPSFVRGVVSKRVETYAQREGHSTITVELLDRIRSDMPIDFSKRLPFFARKTDD